MAIGQDAISVLTLSHFVLPSFFEAEAKAEAEGGEAVDAERMYYNCIPRLLLQG